MSWYHLLKVAYPYVDTECPICGQELAIDLKWELPSKGYVAHDNRGNRLDDWEAKHTPNPLQEEHSEEFVQCPACKGTWTAKFVRKNPALYPKQEKTWITNRPLKLHQPEVVI